MDGRMDGWTDGSVDGHLDERTDGQTDACLEINSTGSMPFSVAAQKAYIFLFIRTKFIRTLGLKSSKI